MSPITAPNGNLSLREAAARAWDVIVIGAGPSGSAMARLLGPRHAVLLVDKASFPRFKVCGCFLNRSALQSLQALGLGALPERFGAPSVSGVRLGCRGRTAQLRLPPGVGFSRVQLDTALIGAATERGARFLPETEARVGEAVAGRRLVKLRRAGERTTCQARVVVVSDGIGGSCLTGCRDIDFAIDQRSLIGAAAITEQLPPGYREGTIHMAIGEGGYVGAMQTEDGRMDVAAALERHALKGAKPGELAAAICHSSGLPEIAGLADLPWRGTPPLTRRPTAVAAPRLFLVGDASGYIEPFTGEGMAWALLSARSAAPIVSAAIVDWDERCGDAWRRERRRLLSRRQQVCKILTRGLRRPLIATALVRLLNAVPFVATPVIEWLSTAPALGGKRWRRSLT